MKHIPFHPRFSSKTYFGSIKSPNPLDYSTKAYPTENKAGVKTSVWVPAANPKKPFLGWNHLSHSVVHALTVFKDETQFMVRLLVQNRPAMGGLDTVEAPAGKYADTDLTETAALGAQRELEEETGLRPKKILMLSDDGEDSSLGASIATSPGITNERKAFALILAEQANGKTNLTESEKKQNVRQLDVPLKTFLSPTLFQKWLANIKQEGKLVGVDIPALRGLLPSRQTLKKFLENDK